MAIAGIFSAVFTFLVLGLAIHVAMNIAYGMHEPSSATAIYFVLRLTKQVLIGLALFGACVLFAGWIGMLLIGLLIATIVIAIGKTRSIRKQILLSTITTSLQKGVPLTDALRALAGERVGSTGSAARRIERLLSSGISLPDAIAQTHYALPRHTAAYAQIGELAGAADAALDAAANRRSAGELLWHSTAGRLFYVSTVVLYMIFVGTFMMIQILSAYRGIFNDFELALPWPTVALVGTSNFVVNSSPFLAGPVILLACVSAGSWVARELGWIRVFPFESWFLATLDSADVLRMVAVAVEREIPIYKALHVLGINSPWSLLQWRLRKAVVLINEGRHWCASLHAAKLIGLTDAAVLQSAERVGNLPWALRTTADNSVRRMNYRLQWLVQLLSPCILILLGALIMLFVVGMFMPLVDLISGLT